MMIQLVPFQNKDSKIKISAEVSQKNQVYILRFEIQDPQQEIKWNSQENNSKNLRTFSRKNDLWKKNCFELFLSSPKETFYWEFNFDLFGNWNCYYFEKERFPNPPLESLDFNLVSMNLKSEQTVVSLSFEIHSKLNLHKHEASLCSVLTNQQDQLIYFSKNHLDLKPNFHLRSSFSYFF